LRVLSHEERTIVLYESTYRIEKLLTEINSYMPERFLVVCRELTKKFEETWRGTASEILISFGEKITKGEFVVVLAPLDWKVIS
jgi:16S rRNA (cytidine1402-2'-O)-methyltransferase